MKRAGRGMIVVCLTVMAVGMSGLIIGTRLSMSGAALQDQTGQGDAMGLGLFIALIGLAMLMMPPVTWLGRTLAAENARRRAWKAGLTPQERALVTTTETAALLGAAWAGHSWAERQGERARQRYDETDAAALRFGTLSAQPTQQQDQATISGTGVLSSAPVPDPGQYQP